MIGMSPGVFGGFWNPRAKNAQLEYNGMPMSAEMPMGGMNEVNIQGPGLQMAPTGNEANMPPISPSRNVLSKHMALPNQNPVNTPRMGMAVPRSPRRFGMGRQSPAPMIGGQVGGVRRGIF